MDAIDPGYDKLASVLSDAYAQAASGKGKERHANDRAFDKQPILEIARMVGVGFLTGQVMKKVQEATGMFDRGLHDAAIRELHGAIVYTAAACIRIDETADRVTEDQYGLIFPVEHND